MSRVLENALVTSSATAEKTARRPRVTPGIPVCASCLHNLGAAFGPADGDVRSTRILFSGMALRRGVAAVGPRGSAVAVARPRSPAVPGRQLSPRVGSWRPAPSAGGWSLQRLGKAPAPGGLYRDVDGLLAEEQGLRLSDESLQVNLVQWYPGHIARAERQLKEQLSKVDILFQVLDARIPLSTMHPEVPEWIGNKPQIIIVNRSDMVTKEDMQQWQSFLARKKVPVIWTNGKNGQGCPKVVKVALKLSGDINAKRTKRGLKPRAVRAAVVGFPNVGKSALINRFLGRRTCASAPKPGVTRSLKWVRVDKDLELLDSPGIIPGRFDDQIAASRLAMCNDIGEAAYIDSLIAAKMVEIVRKLPDAETINDLFDKRYGIRNGEDGETGEDFVARLADQLFQGDMELAGSRILNDYRKCHIGAFCLESPPRGRGGRR